MTASSGGMAGWAFWLAVSGAVFVVVGPVLHRVGVLPLGPALLAVPLGVVLSLVALLLSVIVLGGGRPTPAGRGLVVGAVVASAVASRSSIRFTSPPIPKKR